MSAKNSENFSPLVLGKRCSLSIRLVSHIIPASRDSFDSTNPDSVLGHDFNGQAITFHKVSPKDLARMEEESPQNKERCL